MQRARRKARNLLSASDQGPFRAGPLHPAAAAVMTQNESWKRLRCLFGTGSFYLMVQSRGNGGMAADQTTYRGP